MKRRRILGLAALALAGLAGLLGLRWTQAAARGAVRVERQDLPLTVDLSGSLFAVHSELIGPPILPNQWDFKISMMAPEGSTVKKGQPVLRFDSSEIARRLQMKQAEAEQAAKEMEKRETDLELRGGEDTLKLAEARARLRRARLKLEVPPELARAQDLLGARLDAELFEKEIGFLERRMSAAERAAAAELLGLREKKERAEGRVRELVAGMQSLNVVATRDGTIVYKENWRGEKKKAGDSCWRQEKVLEIPDPSELYAEGEVDEVDIGRVATGQRVSIRLDAHPDVEFRGRIESISGVVGRASPTSPVKVAKVRVALGKLDPERMRPGMRFRGTIEVGRIPDVLVLPIESLRATADGPVAWRLGWLGSKPVAVRLGSRNPRLVEVRSGLEAGDRVLREAPRREGS